MIGHGYLPLVHFFDIIPATASPTLYIQIHTNTRIYIRKNILKMFVYRWLKNTWILILEFDIIGKQMCLKWFNLNSRYQIQWCTSTKSRSLGNHENETCINIIVEREGRNVYICVVCTYIWTKWERDFWAEKWWQGQIIC